jgi:hypothetical protein
LIGSEVRASWAVRRSISPWVRVTVLFEIADELFVYGVVCCLEGVESGGTCPVEDPEHGEFLMSSRLDATTLARDPVP